MKSVEKLEKAVSYFEEEVMDHEVESIELDKKTKDIENDSMCSPPSEDNISQENRLVFKYPDGSYSYAFKSDNNDAWLELRPSM